MKSKKSRQVTPAGRRSAAKVTVTLELDQIQIDQLLTAIESLSSDLIDLQTKFRGEAFIAEAVNKAAAQIESGGDRWGGMSFDILKLAPIYRKLLPHWQGSREKQICLVEFDHKDDPSFAQTLALAGAA